MHDDVPNGTGVMLSFISYLFIILKFLVKFKKNAYFFNHRPG